MARASCYDFATALSLAKSKPTGDLAFRIPVYELGRVLVIPKRLPAENPCSPVQHHVSDDPSDGHRDGSPRRELAHDDPDHDER